MVVVGAEAEEGRAVPGGKIYLELRERWKRGEVAVAVALLSLSLWCGPWAGVWLPRFRLVAETRGREEQGKGLSRSAFSRRAGPGRIDTGALRSTLPRLQNWWDFARDLDGFRANFEPVLFHASQMFPSSLFAMKWI